jgi:cephalosporin-C deacetylase-like acetyl esterase
VKPTIRSCLRRALLAVASIVLGVSTIADREILAVEPPLSPAETIKRKASLETILRLLPPDRTNNGRVSFLDETFKDWLSRTGELPPDFDQMPSIPFLPNPLVIDEGTKNVPVTSAEQWKEKRAWMKRQLEYYVTGTRPPAPDNLKASVLDEKKDGEVTLRTVELSFGPERRATLTVELMVPPGNGPFPVFLTQWNHREWAQVAVRRGYIGCVYAGADSKDDTEKYSEIWAGHYDFTRLMRRAYGASRAVDYLYTLPVVDKDRIGITGHSRNGKQSLIAAAFDERITACIPSSGGTGAEMPWRYCSINYDIEDIALLACAQPAWLHPRLRFFIGRENKLPVDQNSFMALIAPRGLMLSTAITEGASNPWGMEQAYHASRKVFDFLHAGDRVAIRSRYGLHSVSARDMEDYIDFFDYVFGRTNRKPENRLLFDYSFDQWRQQNGEQINPNDYPAKSLDDLEIDAATNRKIATVADWERKRADVKNRLRWALGDEPPGVTNPGPNRFQPGGAGENSFGSFLVRPAATKKMGVAAIAPYNGFGDQLFGYLYYPIDEKGNAQSGKLPVVTYLHELDYSKGFNSYHQVDSLLQNIVAQGYAVFAFDMLGFGNRIEEGTRFYDRYPHWSKMGKMVVDVRGAVDALRNMEGIDPRRIFVAGYSLGGKVGLYAAALDERIAGVISVAGFTPMRLATEDKGFEGIRADSHLHGLMPRLGFFVGNEARVPHDYHEVLACIAPRPVLVVAPTMDKDHVAGDVRRCVDEARKIYGLYGASNRLELSVPDDYSRFSPEMRATAYDWLRAQAAANR